MCIRIYTHTLSYWLVGFEVQQKTNIALQSIKEKNRRPSSFQMVILSDRSTLNFRHLQFKIVTWSLRFECVFTFIVHLFSKLFGTVFWGHSDCHNTSQERACLWCQFQVFKFGLGCGFFCLWSLRFICNNCTFNFLYPLTPEFSFFPPSPHSYIHSWTILSGKAPWWKDQDRNSDHSSVFSLE